MPSPKKIISFFLPFTLLYAAKADCDIASQFLHNSTALEDDLQKEIAGMIEGRISAKEVLNTIYAITYFNSHCLRNTSDVMEGRVTTHNGGIVGAIPDQDQPYSLMTGMSAEIIQADKNQPDELIGGHQGKIQKIAEIPIYFGAHGAHRISAVIDARVKDYFDEKNSPTILPSGKSVPPPPLYFAITGKNVDQFIALKQMVYLAERATKRYSENASLPMGFSIDYSETIAEQIENDPELKKLKDAGQLRVRDVDSKKIPHKVPSEAECKAMIERSLQGENLYYGEGTEQKSLPIEAMRTLGACGVKTLNLDFVSTESRKNLYAHLGMIDFLLAHETGMNSSDFKENLIVIKNALEKMLTHTTVHTQDEFFYEWLAYQPWKAIAFAYQTYGAGIPDDKIPNFTPQFQQEDYWKLFYGNVASSLLIVLVMRLRQFLNEREKGSNVESVLRGTSFAFLAYTNELLPWIVKLISVSGVITPYSLTWTIASYASSLLAEILADLVKFQNDNDTIILLLARAYTIYRYDYVKSAIYGKSEQRFRNYESFSPELVFLIGCITFNLFGLTDATHTFKENALKVLCITLANATPFVVQRILKTAECSSFYSALFSHANYSSVTSEASLLESPRSEVSP